MRRLFNRVILSSSFVIALFATAPQSAAGFAGVPGSCGTMCLANGGGPFRPFYGAPYFPQMPNNYYAYQTGQMSFYGPQTMYPQMDMTPVFVSNAINWYGAPQIGGTLGSPVGLSLIGENALYRGITGQ